MYGESKNRLPKLESLQALRAIAFLGIFLSHCALTNLGSWGVSIFFILSGFVMIYNYLPNYECSYVSLKKSFKFSLKKIKKLYPLHIFMTVMALPFFLFDYINDFSLDRFLQMMFKVLTNLTLTQSWFPQLEIRYSMNNLSWYLSVCVFLYLCFPFILKVISKYKSVRQAIWISILIYMIQIVIGMIINDIFTEIDSSGEITKGLTYNSPIYRLIDFILGCNLGYIFLNRRCIKNEYIKCSLYEIFLMIGTVLLILINKSCIKIESLWWTRTILYTISSMVIVYCFAQRNGLLTKILSNNSLIKLGNISAYTYLIHEMVIRYVSKILLYIMPIKQYMVRQVIICIISFILTLVATKVWIKIENYYFKSNRA